jgi:glycosyltransferase involved in cell wall biosynthesis
MKVSVIMCAYNVAPYIERAIESILSQTYQDWELIICDDRSTDNTVALINKYTNDSRIRLIEQKENIGYIKNKNNAFSYATGELLTQLDGDDTSHATRLEKQVNAFINYPEIKICGTNYQMVNLQDNYISGRTYEKDTWVTEITNAYPFWFPGLMFRRSIMNEFGLFSEYFNGIYGDDYHWTLRVNQKYPIYFVKDVLYNYRANPSSLTISYNGNKRKLIAPDLIAILYKQRKETGTDMIDSGRQEELAQIEQTLFDNKILMAEKFRVWAAKAVDVRNWEQAKKLLGQSFSLDKTNVNFYKTLLYYFRQRKKVVAPTSS